jgi:hypothetical protein
MTDTPPPNRAPLLARIATILIFAVVIIFALPHIIPIALGWIIVLAVVIPLAALVGGGQWLWARMHLSTMLIVTLLVAGLVWLNVRQRFYPYPERPSAMGFRAWGWPRDHFIERDVQVIELFGDNLPLPEQSIKDTELPSRYTLNVQPFEPYGWRWDMVALNVAICLALLAVAAIATEWVTRRMKRKPNP